jgi:hypothetical protein
MLALKYLLMVLGVGLFSSAGILVACDIYIAARLRWLLEQSSGEPGTEAVQRKAPRPFGPVRWRLALQLALAGVVPVLLAGSIVMVPMDGKNFFASDVMRSAFQGGIGSGGSAAPSGNDDSDDPVSVATATAQRKQGKRP